MAIYEAKSSGGMYSFLKSTINSAGGMYGDAIKVGSSIASGVSRDKVSVLRQVELTGGYVYDNIIYDGYTAFLRPHPESKTIKVMIPGVKLHFNAKDEPGVSHDFIFEYNIGETNGL